MDHFSTTVTNRTMPSCTIIPVLVYADVSKAIDWLCEIVGCTERWRAGGHRAQLALGDGAIAISGSSTQPPGQPVAVMPQTHSMMVRVQDVDAHYERARQKGATILQAPADFPYGERQYTLEDIGGHHWTFTQTVRDLMPEEWGGSSGKDILR